MKMLAMMILVTSMGYTTNIFAQEDSSESDDNEKSNTIVITATRSEKPLIEVPAAVTVQDMEELRKSGFTYGTDEFRGVPGVFFRRGEGDGDEFPFISIRGITGNHGNDTFLALVDGIPFVGPDEEVLLYEVPYAIVDQIDIVRGPVSALYGRGAIGGAVNYKTVNPDEGATHLSISAGSDAYYRGHALVERQLDSGTSILASLSTEDYEGWRENSARKTTNAFFKGNIQLDNSSMLTAWVSLFDREAEIPSVIPTLADGTIVDVVGGNESFLGYRPTRNNIEGWIGAIRYESKLSENLSAQTTFQARKFDTDILLNFYDYFEFNPDQNIMGVNGFGSVNEANIYFLESVFNWSFDNHNLIAGLSAERTTLDEEDRWSGELDPFFSGECNFRFYAILIDYSTGQVTNDQPDNTCFVREQLRTAADTNNQFYGLFVQDEIAVTDRLTVTLGARFDKFERDIDYSVIGSQEVSQSASGDADAVSPKASITYRTDTGIVYGSYGRGFNSNFGPIFQWEPDRYARDEKPTTIDSYELGWKGQTDDRSLYWELALFYLEQNDRRIFISNPDASGPPQLATTGQLYSSNGFESLISWRLSDKTQLSASYTHLNPEWDELMFEGSFGGPDQDFSGTTPQGIPESLFYTELSHHFSDSLSAKVTYEWYGDYYVDLSNSVKAGQYDLTTLSLSYDLPSFKNTAIDFAVTNLFDEDYYFYFAGSRTAATNVTPGVPRQFRLTLRTRF